MITTLAKLTAQHEKESLMAEICITLAKETREKEKGCLMYIPHVSAENPAEIIIFGKYVDHEAFEAHKQSPHFMAAKEKLFAVVEEKSTDILDGELIVHILQELI